MMTVLSLGACASTTDTYPTFISPLDGQTDVPATMPLRVHGGTVSLPPEAPVSEDVLRVVDALDGGFVKGTVRRDGFDLVFEPLKPWAEDRTYVWEVGDVFPASRQPQFDPNGSVLGTAVFATSGHTVVLNAHLNEDGRLCAVLSRRVTAANLGLDVTVDDEELTVEWEVFNEADLGLPLTEPDRGISWVCSVPDTLPDGLVEVDQSVRLWSDSGGPWRFTLTKEITLDVVGMLRRQP